MDVIGQELLNILICPETRSRLTLADPRLVAKLNTRIEARQLRNKAGDLVEKPLDGGLLREDGSVLYPIVDRIPVLLVDESIPLEAADHPPPSQPR